MIQPRKYTGVELELKRTLAGEVRFDAGTRAIYSTDASNYRQPPIGVVVPRTVDDVVKTISAARIHHAPILSRGGGTSLAGQCCNEAIVMDMSKYLNAIVEINPAEKFARVQPGVVLDDLRAAAEVHHVTFGPDPATHNHCTLGGMIGNNSCGVHSVMAGKTDDNIEELDILLYDGTRMSVGATDDTAYERIVAEGGRKADVYQKLKILAEKYAGLIREKFPNIPRCVSGYNLRWLLPENGFHVARALVGSEGTCVTVLEAKVKLVHSPPARTLVVLGYPDVYEAGDHILEILSFKPIALEGVDDNLVDGMRKKGLHLQNIPLLPPGGGWLFVEFGAETMDDSRALAEGMLRTLFGQPHPPTSRICADVFEAKRLWSVREAALAAAAAAPGQKERWEGWEDSAVDPAKLGMYLRDLRALMKRFDYEGAFYGHFGQACLHTRISFDLVTESGLEQFRKFMFDAADLVIKYGGSISGEHGDGQSRGELLPKMFGEELMQAFREFKAIWDPERKMNPGKLIDAYRMDENLRLGAGFTVAHEPTVFAFASDEGSLSNAAMRCVGVGECRRSSGGTMCPSYRATKEEMHSTRGRARILFEMLQGDVLTKKWQEESVKEAMDLCLACKGCKTDCPANVDMATYKAEFLSHYYREHSRPRTAYSFGLIQRWARLGSLAPAMTNFFTHAPVFSNLSKLIAGIAPARSVPKFAPVTLRSMLAQRVAPEQNGASVMLWPDTFTNHFRPDIGIAAVEVLERAGFTVVLPPNGLCCGRPLYDYGMLETAKTQLEEILVALAPTLALGTKIVGLEPSCVAVFRDELVGLFPEREDALKLSRSVFTLAEFLESELGAYPFLASSQKVLFHGHCHQKAVMKTDADVSILRKIGMDVTVLDAGCCGMAGSFGFEEKHFEISMEIGELALLPLIRKAQNDVCLISDGFSCSEQIISGAGKRPLHLAEALHASLMIF
jgi:FAD/FMN-containing dehydrogenase/Fe-S oxidoreductase